jgi:TetR/AcrR family transcriptional repressor of nem operon
MARRKEFDEQEVLERALELFWRRGYVNTSVEDLLSEMHINRWSLYQTFGDKHALFMRALDAYCQRWRGVIHERVTSASSPRACLDALLDALVKQIADDRDGRGCLVVNSAFEYHALPEDARAVVRRSLASLEGVIQKTVERAQHAGELPRDRDPRAVARLVIATLNGARSLWRIERDPERLKGLIDQLRAAL